VNRDVGQWVSPIVAVVVLAVVTAQIFAALQVTGAFGWHAAAPRVLTSPAYRSLDRAIDRHDPSFTVEGLRDPFMYGASGAHDGNDPPLPRRQKPAPPVVLAVPVLTAIVWDSDPRALIRWNEREWTVREGGLFDEFQVVRITRDHVTLRRGEETLELHRRNPGE
jgi:hypothetical protein